MLNLKQLQELLRENDRLQRLEMARIGGANTKRLIELQFHRSMIKDCIIEVMGGDRRAS